ncbi:RNA 2',3'-cyclic phosphodiesterase [Leptospira perolatii]|uniref:RNA 2',3'-cyclic phosphodiesterase n=1 Tax=Leptospira perolatii TaxID=2023191 RepID=A0A2M9ZRD5_9LEPT|nr:RNA 2',3'-cyclic phosphodiesterase [Leptospira perolatii]PJZ70999.1 RNA 2',3'-cyclic phosphodiesterase [Leptospira perolatii]PJZ74531.1 RNA 2',3'-cyclic phosphodiesterase [Leptospira perolatii]
MRIFVGISLPEEVRESIAGICYGLPGIKWVPAENLHLTLVFLGELPEIRRESLSEFCSTIQFRPFSFNLKGIEWFIKKKSPSILYIDVEPAPELLELQKTIDSGLRRLGFTIEGKNYKPHITIGRFKDVPMDKVVSYMEEFRDFVEIGIPAQEFHVYSSRSGPNGQMYRIEESFPNKA